MTRLSWMFIALAIVFAVAGIALQSIPQRTVTDDSVALASARADSAAAAAAATAPAPPAPPELPALRVGESLSEVSATMPGVIPRSVNASFGNGASAYEWNETMGRYMLAEFVDGRLVIGNVRRPYVDRLPPVEASALQNLHPGMTRAEIEAQVGPGYAMTRAVATGIDGDLITDGWSIRDRGVGSGRNLMVTYRDGRAASVIYPGARP